jgi:hypothetical protein
MFVKKQKIAYLNEWQAAAKSMLDYFLIDDIEITTST